MLGNVRSCKELFRVNTKMSAEPTNDDIDFLPTVYNLDVATNDKQCLIGD